MGFCFPQTDAHVHPDFSIDSKGSIEEYCHKALSIGLHEIIFTTHVDTNKKYPGECKMVVDGQRVPTNIDAVKRYAEAVTEARQKYYELGLMVKCGVEIDFYPELDQTFLKLFEDSVFEYVLAGVHRVDDFDLSNKQEAGELYAKYPVPVLLEKYYDLVKLVTTYKVFDCIAHLDYYRRCAPMEKLAEAMRVDYDFIPESLQVIADNAMAIEVNTSALRHGHSEYYPSMALLNLARKAGVLIRHLGSDAHRPEQLAHDFEDAEIIVYETNIADMDEG
ncbi:MAG: histidinol-phosphatase HisJ family protein [Candidatus Zixiibacteriota bacterium]